MEGHRALLPDLFLVFFSGLVFGRPYSFLVLRGFDSGFALNSRLANLVLPLNKFLDPPVLVRVSFGKFLDLLLIINYTDWLVRCIASQFEFVYLNLYTIGYCSIVFLYSKFLLIEMLELILNASFLGIMITEWNSVVQKKSTLSSGYSLYLEVSSSVGKHAYAMIKSVTYDWNCFVRLKRRYLLKSCKYTLRILFFIFYLLISLTSKL